MSDVIIRDARAGDRDAIRALTLAAYAEYATLMEPGAWKGLEGALHAALATQTAGVQWITAERDGRIVGSVALFPPALDAYGSAAAASSDPELRLLAVSPQARGLGVGRALVEECIRRARASGAPALGLHSSHSMRSAIALYESMGFLRVPERDFETDGSERVQGFRLVF